MPLHYVEVNSDLKSAQGYISFFKNKRFVLQAPNISFCGLQIVNKIKPAIMEFLRIKGDYRSIVIKKEYRPRAKTLERIRNGDY